MAMETRYTCEFDCTPEHLWPFIEEPEHQKKWMKGLLSNEPLDEDPTRVGSRFRMQIKEGGRVSEYEGEVTKYDRPNLLGIRFGGGHFPPDMEMHVDYTLVGLGHRTRLEYFCECTHGKLPFAWKVMMPIGKLFNRVMLRGFMKRLKALAESDGARSER